MERQATLDQLRKALFQANNALKKRALAIIHNESLVEAESMLLEFMGTEQDPDLLTLSLKVLKKVQDYANISEQVPTEALLPLLDCPDIERRLVTLRALVGKRSPQLAARLIECFAEETHAETLLLVTQILRSNPDLCSLAFLRKQARHEHHQIRAEAIQAINTVIDGCLITELLVGVIDQAESVQVVARHLLAELSHKRIGDVIAYLLSGEPAMSQLGATVLGSFLASEFAFLIRENIEHPDPKTRELVRKAAQDRARLLSETAPKKVADLVVAHSADLAAISYERLYENFVSSWKAAPSWIFEPFSSLDGTPTVEQTFDASRQVFARVSFLLVLTFILTYFQHGNRNVIADNLCFTMIQDDFPVESNLVLLQTLADILPKPHDSGGLFSLQVAAALVEIQDPTFLSLMQRLQNHFFPTAEELRHSNPQAITTAATVAMTTSEVTGNAETKEYLPELTRDFTAFLTAMAGFTEQSRLLAKIPCEEGLKVIDFWQPVPQAVSNDLTASFNSPIFSPLLVSRDSLATLNLAPFLVIDANMRTMIRKKIGERHLWPIFEKLGVNDAYREFLAGS